MLPIGKLDSELLKTEVFSNLTYRHPNVLIRPSLGEDCAVLDSAGGLCVLTTDPITGADSALGKLAVHVNCNDIATQGIRPTGLMLTLLAPPGTTADDIRGVMNAAAVEAERIGVEIIGGHTEITTAVTRMVISGVAVGFKPYGNAPVRKPQPGDWLVMTKTAGLEGTGILAADCAERLRPELTDAELETGHAMLEQVSVIEDGVLGARFGALKMHDVTEGGVLGACWELAEAAGLGCEVHPEAIPVHPVTAKLCRKLNLDPMRLISSGSMMLVMPPDQGAFNALQAEGSKLGIPVSRIGQMTETGRAVITANGAEPLLPPESDELYKAIS